MLEPRRLEVIFATLAEIGGALVGGAATCLSADFLWDF
jgi:hypothetical protein